MATQEILHRTVHLSRTLAESAVYGALVHLVGVRAADMIDFYVDTRLATDDPEKYEQVIKLLLGEFGGGLLVQGVKSELTTPNGKPTGIKETFGDQMRAFERALAES
jgi:hypothetical protein